MVSVLQEFWELRVMIPNTNRVSPKIFPSREGLYSEMRVSVLGLPFFPFQALHFKFEHIHSLSTTAIQTSVLDSGHRESVSCYRIQPGFSTRQIISTSSKTRSSSLFYLQPA
jgi:hypothetical protein